MALLILFHNEDNDLIGLPVVNIDTLIVQDDRLTIVCNSRNNNSKYCVTIPAEIADIIEICQKYTADT